jgi:dihydropteroate synthase
LEAKDTFFYKKTTITCEGKLVSLSHPVVMGILNMTPDSFYEGSRIRGTEALLRQAETMLQEGAAILDIGGYSTRPEAAEVTPEEERIRVIPAIRALRQAFPECLISIDTFRAVIAEEAVEAGANIINDVSGGTLDEAMFATAGRLQVPYILMHMRGTPQTMTQFTQYEDIMLDLVQFFEPRIVQLQAAGVRDVMLDPGFGFAKTIDQNFEMLRRLGDLRLLGLPVLVGLSRKSMTYKTLEIPATEALAGTIALNTIALMHGASILRVHDVKEAVQTIKLFKKSIT